MARSLEDMQTPSFLVDEAGPWEELDPSEQAELGRSLRRRGLSYGEITELIPVPKGTLSNWCSEIRLDDSQASAIRARSANARSVPRDTQWKRREEVERIRKDASKQAVHYSSNPSWAVGVALYWAEGAKTERRLSISNSDPPLLRTFVAWVRRFLHPSAEFVLALHLHEGNDEARAQDHWREALALPTARFTKTFIKPRGTGHRRNSLPHGVCRVVMIRSADAWVRTMVWIDVLRDQPAGSDIVATLRPGSLAQFGRASGS